MVRWLQRNRYRQVIFAPKRLSLRAVALICVSMMLMVMCSMDLLNTNRSFLRSMKVAVARFANTPRQWYGIWQTHLQSTRALSAHVVQLQAEKMMLQAKLHALAEKGKENATLRALLSSSPQLHGAFIMVNLIAIPNTAHHRVWLIDRGKKSGVYKGQPAVDAHGIIGQITDVGAETSHLTLVTDHKIAIPVVMPQGQRAVAVGEGRMMRLHQLSDDAHLHLGDVIRASGLGLVFPIGYPVGSVARIVPHTAERSSDIWLKPTAHIDRLHAMLLYWPSKSYTTSSGAMIVK